MAFPRAAVNSCTGKLGETPPASELLIVVGMLDAVNAYKRFADQDIDIFWGAYVGTPDEILISGKLKDVAGDIERVRAEALGGRTAGLWTRT